MNIIITARKTTIKDSFRERAEKKLSKLDRFFNADAQATVVVTNEKERETVEVTIHTGGMLFRAERTTSDRLDSLDQVIDALFRQIVKNKSKLEGRGKTISFDTPVEGYEDLQDEQYRVVRSKKFPIKPMSVDEAILQMNMLGHSFFMFRSAETHDICVVYKRKDGNYGLLEPSDT